MRFLVDAALSPAVAQGLVAHGHDAIHVRDYGLAAAADDVILKRAAREDRILLSADTDFGTLLALSNARAPSVILFRDPVVGADVQVRLLLANLGALEQQLRDGCIVVMQPGRMRIRDLPFGEWR